MERAAGSCGARAPSLPPSTFPRALAASTRQVPLPLCAGTPTTVCRPQTEAESDGVVELKPTLFNKGKEFAWRMDFDI